MFTTGDMLIVSDCKHVVDQCNDQMYDSPSGPNADVWRSMKHTFKDRVGSVRVVWLKAHQEPSDVIKYQTSAYMLLGNAYSDHLQRWEQIWPAYLMLRNSIFKTWIVVRIVSNND